MMRQRARRQGGAEPGPRKQRGSSEPVFVSRKKPPLWTALPPWKPKRQLCERTEAPEGERHRSQTANS